MVALFRRKIEKVLQDCMDQSSAFGINTRWLRQKFDYSVLVKARTIVEFRNSARGEANRSHTGDDTPTHRYFSP
jgi:hypothetical protein